MSDHPLGPGWWQASDLKWYPPHLAPGPGVPGPQPQAPDNTAKIVIIVVGVVFGLVALLGVGAAVIVFSVGNTTSHASAQACQLELREIKTAAEAYKYTVPSSVYPPNAEAMTTEPTAFLTDTKSTRWTYTQTDGGAGYELDGEGACNGLHASVP